MKQHIYQSCGMPLFIPEDFGTNKNGTRIEDYCHYCYKDGQFTQNVTMDEMIEICSKYVKHNTRNQVIAEMRIQYPTLKRWAQKENTQNEYHKSINKVLDYINRHLNENPDLETVSQIANISAFHFHRIFKAIIGENLGEYIQRLRLEYVAGKLKTSDMTLDLLAEKTGYNSQQALSKAFKKHFGIPPSIYKSTPYEKTGEEMFYLTPRICKIKKRNLIYVRIIDEYGTEETYNAAWKKLYLFAVLNKLLDDESESLGVSFDDPSITTKEKCRFYACLSTKKEFKPKGIFGHQLIDSGLYAIFTHKGSYKKLHDLYKNIWFGWLPSSKYKIRQGIHFEKYLNNPNMISEEEILTEIYIPIKEK